MKLAPDQYPSLPKWAGAFVTGKSVTPEQAKDIIFRTDTTVAYPSEYGFGNDRQFGERCIWLFGWKPLLDMDRRDHKAHWDLCTAWAVKMRMVRPSYVTNNWCASCYIGGPHGWCAPDGTIYSWHNYGKWPHVNEIVADWEVLLAAFPYLELVCTLHSSETCGDEDGTLTPVCTIVVGNGKVEVLQPNMALHDRALPSDDFDDAAFMASLTENMHGDFHNEHGWPAGWVEEFGIKSIAAMREVAPQLCAPLNAPLFLEMHDDKPPISFLKA